MEIQRGSFYEQLPVSKGWVAVVGKSSPPPSTRQGDEGLRGHHVGHVPSLPGIVLFAWLPQRCLRTANRPSGASWGPGQAGTVVPGVPVATIQQELLSDDAWGKTERLVTQRLKLATLVLNKCF